MDKRVTKEEVLDFLESGGYRLGGSRRMAQKYPDKIHLKLETDYDYYCEESEQRRHDLVSLGFELIQAQNRVYWDDLLIDIYKHPQHPIEVLIRRHVDIYRDAFESLSAEVFINKLWKSSPVAYSAISKEYFKSNVCHYFNTLFRLHGYSPDSLGVELGYSDEVPF